MSVSTVNQGGRWDATSVCAKISAAVLGEEANYFLDDTQQLSSFTTMDVVCNYVPAAIAAVTGECVLYMNNGTTYAPGPHGHPADPPQPIICHFVEQRDEANAILGHTFLLSENLGSVMMDRVVAHIVLHLLSLEERNMITTSAASVRQAAAENYARLKVERSLAHQAHVFQDARVAAKTASTAASRSSAATSAATNGATAATTAAAVTTAASGRAVPMFSRARSTAATAATSPAADAPPAATAAGRHRRRRNRRRDRRSRRRALRLPDDPVEPAEPAEPERADHATEQSWLDDTNSYYEMRMKEAADAEVAKQQNEADHNERQRAASKAAKLRKQQSALDSAAAKERNQREQAERAKLEEERANEEKERANEEEALRAQKAKDRAAKYEARKRKRDAVTTVAKLERREKAANLKRISKQRAAERNQMSHVSLFYIGSLCLFIRRDRRARTRHSAAS